jgi:hypothetical protein
MTLRDWIAAGVFAAGIAALIYLGTGRPLPQPRHRRKPN